MCVMREKKKQDFNYIWILWPKKMQTTNLRKLRRVKLLQLLLSFSSLSLSPIDRYKMLCMKKKEKKIIKKWSGSKIATMHVSRIKKNIFFSGSCEIFLWELFACLYWKKDGFIILKHNAAQWYKTNMEIKRYCVCTSKKTEACAQHKKLKHFRLHCGRD